MAKAATADTDTAKTAASLTDKAKTFARERPWAVATLAGVLGIATLNTLRGK